MFKNDNNIPKKCEDNDKNYKEAYLSTNYNEIYVKLKENHYKWNDIRIYINKILSEAGVNEDKQLGFWFISTSVFLQKKTTTNVITGLKL